MDRLANEDHTHIATEEELNVYRSNWWIRSNFVGSDTMPIRYRPHFKEALSTLRRLKNEDQAYYQNWWQSSSSSWWNWQDNWWHPSSETSPRRWTQHWWSGETCENQWIVYLLVEWVSKRIWCKSYSDQFGNSQRSLLSPTGCVKSIPPDTAIHEQNWLRKLYTYSKNESGLTFEPSEPTLAAYDVSKKVISLLRHNQTVQREEDGAIQFYRIKFHLRNHSSQVQHWSDERWKSCLASGGGSITP